MRGSLIRADIHFLVDHPHVRSIIYGAALMIDNGEIENAQQSYDYAEMIIRRELDIGNGCWPPKNSDS